MAWPADYQPGGQGLVATPDEVIVAIGSENPALGPDTVALQCQRRQLKSVSLCLDERFEPSTTGCPLRSSCGDTVMVRPSRQLLGYSAR